MSKKYVNVRYRVRDFEKDRENHLINISTRTKRIETDSTKRYHIGFHILAQLTNTQRLLLDYLCEEMDEENIVTNSMQIKGSFNDLLEKVGLDTYSSNYINKMFNSLCQRGALLKTEGRSKYMINPYMFFKGSEEKRKIIIKRILENKHLYKHIKDDKTISMLAAKGAIIYG